MDRKILVVLIVLLLAAVAVLASYVAIQRSPGWSVTKYLENYDAVSADGTLIPTTLRSFEQGETVMIRDKIVTIIYDSEGNDTTFSFLYEGSVWADPNQHFPRGPDLVSNLWSVTIPGNWAGDYDNGDLITLVGLVRQMDNYLGSYTLEYVEQWGIVA